MNNSTESLARTLCQACGMCCNGFLFGFTPLDSAERDRFPDTTRSSPAESKHGYHLPQPCPYYTTECSIYNDRPTACSEYECSLLKGVISDEISLEQAMAKVSETFECGKRAYEYLCGIQGPDEIEKGLRVRLNEFGRRKESKLQKQEGLKNQLNIGMFLAMKKKYFPEK